MLFLYSNRVEMKMSWEHPEADHVSCFFIVVYCIVKSNSAMFGLNIIPLYTGQLDLKFEDISLLFHFPGMGEESQV